MSFFLHLLPLSGCALCLDFCFLLAILIRTLLSTFLAAPYCTTGSYGKNAWQSSFPIYNHNIYPEFQILFTYREFIKGQFSLSTSVLLVSPILRLNLCGVLKYCSLIWVLAYTAHGRKMFYSTYHSTQLMLSSLRLLFLPKLALLLAVFVLR